MFALLAIDRRMNAQTRILLIQELNNLKIELDRANKLKNQHSELSFTANEEHDGSIKLFATTGSTFKLLAQKKEGQRWQPDTSNQFTNLGDWISDLLKYEIEQIGIKTKILEKINQLYHR